jgi:hypothetical protein
LEKQQPESNFYHQRRCCGRGNAEELQNLR